VLQPPNPVAGAATERSPVVADYPADVILDTVSRELGRDQRGLEDPPWVGPWPTGGSLSPPEARKTALTAVLGVWGPVWRNPRPWDRL